MRWIQDRYSFFYCTQTIISDTNVQTQYAFDDSRQKQTLYLQIYINLIMESLQIFYCNDIKDLQRNVNGTLINISFAFREVTVNSKIDTFMLK